MTKHEIPSSIDVAVIGAGLGGLICALELQRHGLNVCVFEKKHIPGGYAHMFKRKGYTFDVSLHHLGGLGEGDMNYNILHPLGVLDKLDYRKKENLFSARFPDFNIDMPNEKEETLELLSQQFPKEKKNLQQFFEVMKVLKHHVTAPVLFNDFKVEPRDLLSYKYINSSFADLVGEFISDKKLKAVLSQMWTYLGLPPETATANYSACIFASGFIEGAYHIKGGGAALTEAIVERFEELGGKCFYRNGVKKIIVENNTVKGIELAKGEFIATKQVVSNASPNDTFFEMMDENVISKVFKTRISQMEVSNSLHAMYISLDCLPSSIGIPANNFFYNHQYDFSKAYKDCMGQKTTNTDWTCTSPELAEQNIAPKGCGIVSFAELTSPGSWLTASEETYDNTKKRLEKILINKYDKHFPGLKEHSQDIILGTPKTMKRYSSNPLGAVYGFAQTVNQSNNKRLGNRSPIKGLSLAGSWTQAGGGYEGTMMTGLKSAHIVLNGMDRAWLPLNEYAGNREKVDVEQMIEKSGYPMYKLPTLVYPEDSNYKGNVTPTAYMRFFDRGRVALMEQSKELIAMNDDLEKYFVHVYRAVIDIDGFDPMGENLNIHTGYRKSSSHRGAVDQIISNSDNKILAKGLFEIVFVEKGGQLVELPHVYKEYDNLPFELSKPALPKAIFPKNNDFEYSSEYYIYYEDTDAQGIIYNVSYIKFCQKTFYNYRTQILGDRDFNDFSVKRIEIRFLNSAGLRETIEVKACYRNIDSDNFVVDYRILNKATQAVLTDISMEYTSLK
jgi:all-trans-retinol 13,14-reductase